MNCRSAEDELQKLLDGVLTPVERARLDEHLLICRSCRRTVDAQRRLARAAGRWIRPGPQDDPGEDFTARVLTQIAARPVVAPDLPRFWLPLAAMAVLVAIISLLPLPVPDFGMVGASARLLPDWLLANLHAVPTDASGSWGMLTAGLPLPSWLWAALVGMTAVNGGFYAQARRSSARRSLS